MDIRPVKSDEYAAAGELSFSAYDQLGMGELGDYGEQLRDIEGRAAEPGASILVAVDDGPVLGVVTYMIDYGAEFANLTNDDAGASPLADTAGFRMLAVDPTTQGQGVGEALTVACVERARSEGRTAIALHTTNYMQAAQRLYRRLGFERFEAIDFQIGRRNPVPVLGFRLGLS